ncbi:hypothetical protein CK219_12925 [Mesorhizobium sp. WSM4313]|nr:hypothetical protein CK219_12925 [Mesorhizobium sp. WSM4313]
MQENPPLFGIFASFTNKSERGGEDMPLRLGAAEFDFDMAFGLRDDAATEFEGVRAVLQI